MTKNNGIKKVSDLDKGKVQQAIDKFGKEKVKQTLVDRGVEGIQQSDVDVDKIGLVDKQGLAETDVGKPKKLPQKARIETLEKNDKPPMATGAKEEEPKFDKEAWKKEVEEGTKEELEESREYERKLREEETKKARALRDKETKEEIEREAFDRSVEERKKIEEENKQKAIEGLDAMLKEGATIESIQEYSRKNKIFATDIRNKLENYFKNKQGVEFYTKYSNYTPEQLYTAEDSGEFVYGDNLYNMLPEGQREEYKQYRELKGVENIGKATKFGDSIASYIKEINQLLGTGMLEEYKKMLNDPEYVEAQKALSDKQLEIANIDEEIKNVEKNITSKHKGVPESILNGIIRDKTNVLINQKNALVNEYNSKLAFISNKKQDMQMLLGIAQFDKSFALSKYQMAVDQYKTDRANMSAEAVEKLKQQNAEKMVSLQLQADKVLAEFKAGLEKSPDGKFTGKFSVSEGTVYYDSGDGVLQRLPSLPDGGEYYLGDDGVPRVRTRDLDGNVLGDTGLPEELEDILFTPDGMALPSKYGTKYNVKGGMQCAEFVNKVMGTTMGDLLEDKLKVATAKTGKIGDAVVFITDSNSDYAKKYGHTGIIIGEMGDDRWVIKNSNLNGDGTISTNYVYKSQILGYTPSRFNLNTKYKLGIEGFSDAQKTFMDTVDLNELNKDTRTAMNELGLTQVDIWQYRTENIDSKTMEELEGAYNALVDLKGGYTTFDALLEAEGGVWGGPSGFEGVGFRPIDPISGTKEYSYLHKVDVFASLATLSNMGKIKGVLSESDMALLKSASTGGLDSSLDKESFIKVAKKLEKAYLKAMGKINISGEIYSIADVKEKLKQAENDGKLSAYGVQQFWQQHGYTNMDL